MDDTTRQQQQNTIFTPMPSRAINKARNVHLPLFQKKILRYVGASLCFLSELIHLWLLPQQYETFFIALFYLNYGLMFLFIAMAQGVIGASLLFEPGHRLLSFGLWVNALIVVLYIFTHTIGVLVGLAFLPLPIDAWGVGATLAESAAVVILLLLRRDMPRIQRRKERKGTKKRDRETARRNQ
jgi:hypothetical protein